MQGGTVDNGVRLIYKVCQATIIKIISDTHNFVKYKLILGASHLAYQPAILGLLSFSLPLGLRVLEDGQRQVGHRSLSGTARRMVQRSVCMEGERGAGEQDLQGAIFQQELKCFVSKLG